jgi:hypothetical protein
VKDLRVSENETTIRGVSTVKPEVDEAFEWMVLVIGIISAIMIQYPEYFYTLSPGVAEPSLKAAKSVVIPLVITIFIWLIGKLAVSKSVQVLTKVVAWVFVTDVTVTNYYSYMQGLIWYSGFDYLKAGLNDVFVSLGMLLFLLVGPVLTHFVVAPKYREVYPDSTLLRSRVKLAIMYVAIQVGVFGLAIGLAYSN